MGRFAVGVAKSSGHSADGTFGCKLDMMAGCPLSYGGLSAFRWLRSRAR